MPRVGEPDCDRARALQELAGRWKIPLLDVLAEGDRHFAALERALAPISRRMLTRSLRELEAVGLVHRAAPSGPIRVVAYGLTATGRQALDLVDVLTARLGAAAPPDERPSAAYEPR